MADTTQNEFLDFQSQSLYYLYGVMPVANDSLFIADLVGAAGVKNARFRIKEIAITPPQLEYEYDPQLRASFPKNVVINDNITITWYEDAFDSIQKYHLAIMSRAADFSTGIWAVGHPPMIDMNVIKYAFVEGNENIESPFDSLPVPKQTAYCFMKGLQPKSIGEIKYDSSGGSDIKTVQVTYSVVRIDYQNVTSAISEISEDDFWGTAKKLRLF
jgi:hypothetical protein